MLCRRYGSPVSPSGWPGSRETIPLLPGHGIVYTLTKRDAKLVADWLRSRGIDVRPYSGGLQGEEREDLEEALLENRVKALVATIALGMGFDKPDLGFVIHYQTPGSVVAYYQQVGRAGRALETAYGVLLSGEEETDITNYFISTAFPTREEVREVIAALEAAPEGLSRFQLLGRVNLTLGRIDRTIALLSLESPAPVVKQGTKWQLTAATLTSSFWERADRLTEVRHREQRQMMQYVRLERGHMELLIQALDGDPEGVEPPPLPPLPTEVSPRIEQEALAFLRRLDLPLNPRKRWPPGGLPRYDVVGTIAEEHRTEEGRALCLWGDGGWGQLVRAGKQEIGRFDDELVDACVRLVSRWSPDPRPEWVTCIPSLRHPDLVPDFAQRSGEQARPALSSGAQADPAAPRAEVDGQQCASGAKPRRFARGLSRPPSRRLPSSLSMMSSVRGGASRWRRGCSVEHGSGDVWPLALSSLGRS